MASGGVVFQSFSDAMSSFNFDVFIYSNLFFDKFFSQLLPCHPTFSHHCPLQLQLPLYGCVWIGSPNTHVSIPYLLGHYLGWYSVLRPADKLLLSHRLSVAKLCLEVIMACANKLYRQLEIFNFLSDFFISALISSVNVLTEFVTFVLKLHDILQYGHCNKLIFVPFFRFFRFRPGFRHNLCSGNENKVPYVLDVFFTALEQ